MFRFITCMHKYTYNNLRYGHVKPQRHISRLNDRNRYKKKICLTIRQSSIWRKKNTTHIRCITHKRPVYKSDQRKRIKKKPCTHTEKEKYEIKKERRGKMEWPTHNGKISLRWIRRQMPKQKDRQRHNQKRVNCILIIVCFFLVSVCCGNTSRFGGRMCILVFSVWITLKQEKELFGTDTKRPGEDVQ